MGAVKYLLKAENQSKITIEAEVTGRFSLLLRGHQRL